MAVKFANNAKTTLSADATSSATSLTVSDGSVFPSLSSGDHFFLTLEDTSNNVEIVKVTAVSTNTLTVVRAQDDTTARAFSNGDKAELRLTAAGLNSFVSDSGDTMSGDLSVTGDLTVDTNTLHVDSTDNRVGVNTLSPATELDVAGTTPTLTISDTQNKSWTSADTTLGELAFRTRDTSGIGAHNIAFVRAVNEVTSSSTPSGALSFGISAANNHASETMRIDSSGNVGIGESNPSVRLEVNKDTFQIMKVKRGTSGTAAGIITFEQGDGTAVGHIGGAGSGGGLQLRTGTGTGTERMRIDNSGNVGIGESNPDNALHITGAATSGARIKLEQTTAAKNSQVQQGSTGMSIAANGSSNPMLFETNGSERMRIDSSGNVGISQTTGLSAKLNIQTSNLEGIRIYRYGTNANYGGLAFYDDTNTNREARIGWQSNELRLEGADTISYHTSTTERMRIDSSGNVHIGTTAAGSYPKTGHSIRGGDSAIFSRTGSTGETMQVRRAATDGEAIRFYRGTQHTGSILLRDNVLAFSTAGSSERMRITSSGGLAVGTTSTASRFHVHTGSSAESYMQITNSTTGTGSGDGLTIGLNSAEQAIFWQRENNDVRIGTNNTTRMHIDADGSVGIGTVSPDTKLTLAYNVNGSSEGLKLTSATRTTTEDSLSAIEVIGNSNYGTVFNVQMDGQIQLSPRGNEALRITTSGNVGIGTTSPSFKLDVAGNARANYFALRANETAPSESAFVYRPSTGVLGFGTATAERMRIDDAGRVGMYNETSPTANLHITGEAESGFGAGLRLQIDNNNSTDNLGTISFANNVNDDCAMIRGFTSGGNQLGGLLFATRDGSSTAERIRITSNGEFLQGTTTGASSPSVNFTSKISSGGNYLQTSSGSNGGAIFGTGGSGDFKVWTHSGAVGSESYTQRMLIDSSGRLGLGTGSPSAPFQIHEASSGASYMRISNDTTGSGSGNGLEIAVDSSERSYFWNYENTDMYFGTNNTSRMRLNAGGQLLINHTSNRLNGAVESKAGSGVLQRAYTAEITSSNGSQVCYWAEADITSGTAYFGYFRYNNSNVGGIFGTSSSTSFTTSSDYRLKENVEAMTGAITRVKSLKPKRFSWIIDDLDGANVDGFLAHEAAAVVPESVVGTHNEVDGNGDPVYQSIDQSKLVPLLTAALQEAITKIETLETKVAALEAN